MCCYLTLYSKYTVFKTNVIWAPCSIEHLFFAGLPLTRSGSGGSSLHPRQHLSFPRWPSAMERDYTTLLDLHMPSGCAQPWTQILATDYSSGVVLSCGSTPPPHLPPVTKPFHPSPPLFPPISCGFLLLFFCLFDWMLEVGHRPIIKLLSSTDCPLCPLTQPALLSPYYSFRGLLSLSLELYHWYDTSYPQLLVCCWLCPKLIYSAHPVSFTFTVPLMLPQAWIFFTDTATLINIWKHWVEESCLFSVNCCGGYKAVGVKRFVIIVYS